MRELRNTVNNTASRYHKPREIWSEKDQKQKCHLLLIFLCEVSTFCYVRLYVFVCLSVRPSVQLLREGSEAHGEPKDVERLWGPPQREERGQGVRRTEIALYRILESSVQESNVASAKCVGGDRSVDFGDSPTDMCRTWRRTYAHRFVLSPHFTPTRAGRVC